MNGFNHGFRLTRKKRTPGKCLLPNGGIVSELTRPMMSEEAVTERQGGVREFFRKRPLAIKKDFRRAFKDTERFLNRHRWICLAVTVMVLAVCAILVHPHDRTWLEGLHVEDRERHLQLMTIARDLGHWGDFAQFNLGGAILLWVAGYILMARWVQRLAIVTLVAAMLAGITCNAFRFTMGRPRPKAKVEDAFYGIPGSIKGWNYHGFPSGHTSTAFGSGIPVFVVAGPWGAPVAGFSASIAWARMYHFQHYPTDVIVGGYLGCLFGVAGGLRLRGARLRQRRMRRLARQTAAEGESTPS